MRGPMAAALAGALVCGCTGGGADGDGASSTGETGESTTGPSGTPASASASASGVDDTAGSDDTGGVDTGTTGDPDPPRVACMEPVTEAPGAPPDHGFATLPPAIALADTFYGYAVRTRIGSCATDTVRWTYTTGPLGSSVEVAPGTVLTVGDSVEWTDGGEPREHARVIWNLEGAAAGCVPFELTWEAWLDCDDGTPAGWGTPHTQRWELDVRENRWWSGDVHVHTRHSERGDEAGGAKAYYDRMINALPDDNGDDFADRRLDSLRGRLHWVVFSEHTDREIEECGRHFASWCAEGESIDIATGRDVVRELTEADPTTLLVAGSEISNQFGGHFGFLPLNPYPDHPIYAPGYLDNPTDYDHDAGFGPGVFRERWVDDTATNAEEIALMHDMNALAIVNHESAVAPWVEYDWSSLDFDGLEVWNGGNRHDQDDDQGLHGNMDLGDVTSDDLLSIELPEDPIVRSYIGMLKTGRWPMVLVGGSDVHAATEVVCGSFPCDPTNAQFASPMTTVWAEDFVWTNGATGVVDGIAAGRVVVHDRSNFIDLRVTVDGAESMIGDTVEVQPGDEIEVRAFGRVSNYIDGDNRVLLLLGTSGVATDRVVDVRYNSEDDTHFVDARVGLDEMRYIRPDASFDRTTTFTLSDAELPAGGTYLVWAQFLPWHNPLYAFGNGRDHALTGVIRLRRAP